MTSDNAPRADDGSSDIDTFPAHAIGVNAISWSPAMSPGSLTSGPQQQQQQQPGQQQQQQAGAGSGEAGYQKKFASAGCDGVVRIWNYKSVPDAGIVIPCSEISRDTVTPY